MRAEVAVAAALVMAGCVPQDSARVDPREVYSARAAVPEVTGRRASARLEPVGRHQLRGTVFFRESPRDLAVEAVVASFEPGEYHVLARDGDDCVRPAAAVILGAGSAGPAAGDLGLLEVGDDGAGRLALTTERLSLEPGSGLVGRIVTVAPVGREAEPLACGVVELER